MAFCQAVKSYNSLVRVPLQRSHWPHNRGADPDLAHKLSGLEFLGFDTQSRKIAICIWTNLTEFNSWLKLCITVIYGAPKVSMLNEYIIMKYIWIKCAKSLGFYCHWESIHVSSFAYCQITFDMTALSSLLKQPSERYSVSSKMFNLSLQIDCP